MEHIKSKIGQGGLILAAMSMMSIILSVFNYNIRLLAWIDIWGSTIGWIIRVILIILGGGLFIFFGRSTEDDDV